MLEWTHGGVTRMDCATAVPAMFVADFLQMPSLVDDCAQLLCGWVTLETVLATLETALTLHAETLQEECIKLNNAHAAEILKSEALARDISEETLSLICESDELNLPPEHEIRLYKAVVRSPPTMQY